MPDYLNVGVLWTSGAPLSGTAFLFTVFIELGVSEDSHTFALVLERYGVRAIQLLLALSANRQDDWDRQVDGPT